MKTVADICCVQALLESCLWHIASGSLMIPETVAMNCAIHNTTINNFKATESIVKRFYMLVLIDS